MWQVKVTIITYERLDKVSGRQGKRRIYLYYSAMRMHGLIQRRAFCPLVLSLSIVLIHKLRMELLYSRACVLSSNSNLVAVKREILSKV